MGKKSVYIHIPFCKTICSYCDFCKFYYNEKWINDYLYALEKEIQNNYKDEVINTIYIGGGSPSALSISELNKLFEIMKIFNFDKSYEFTFECNLNDITEELIEFLYNNKVNRISIGIESFDDNNLKFLNRVCNYEDAKEKVLLCKNIGIENINVDLMYSLPTESLEILKSDLEKIISLDVTHISSYSLMIEKNTIIYNDGIKPINEDLDAQMYSEICSFFTKNDFNHYEVSNFAKKDFESKHNLVYWNNQNYYGFGCGASGYIDNVRYDNTRNLLKYINGNCLMNKEILSKKEIMDYEIILGFRKIKGININNFYKKYKVSIFDAYPIKELIDKKELIMKDDYVFINPKKIYVMNEVLIKLV